MAGGNVLYLPHYKQAVHHFTEHHVLAVKEVALGARDEELAPVGVGTAVGHREEARCIMFKSKVLVGKRRTVDTR